MIVLIVITAAIVASMITAVMPVIIPAVIAVITATVIVTLPVAWGIFMVVPVVTDKIDPFATGAVLMAVLAPVLGMAGRDTQVERRATDRAAFDADRLRVEQDGRREAADIEAAIEAWMADIDRDTDIGGQGRGAEGGCSNGSSD